MLEWLKTILGEAYNEEIDKKVSTEIGKAFVARADFNAANDAKKQAETDAAAAIKTRDDQIAELKKVDPAKLQEKITELQTQNTAEKQEHEKQLKQLKLDTAVDARLIKEGAVNPKAVRALLDAAKISLDGENVVGLDEQLKALKESEKWAFTPVKQVKSGLPKGDPAGGEEKTLADEISETMFGPASN